MMLTQEFISPATKQVNCHFKKLTQAEKIFNKRVYFHSIDFTIPGFSRKMVTFKKRRQFGKKQDGF